MEPKANVVIEKRNEKAELKRLNSYIKAVRTLEQKTKHKEENK